MDYSAGPDYFVAELDDAADADGVAALLQLAFMRAGHLMVSRRLLRLAVVSAVLLVSACTSEPSAEAFPENAPVEFVAAAPLSNREGAVAVSLEDSFIVGGGFSGSPDRPVFFDDWARYETVTDTWELLPPAPFAGAWGRSAVAHGNTLVVWGGSSAVGGLSDVATGGVYDFELGVWLPLLSPGGVGPIADARTVALEDRILFAGTTPSGGHSLVEFNSATMEFVSTGFDEAIVDMTVSETGDSLLVVATGPGRSEVSLHVVSLDTYESVERAPLGLVPSGSLAIVGQTADSVVVVREQAGRSELVTWNRTDAVVDVVSLEGNYFGNSVAGVDNTRLSELLQGGERDIRAGATGSGVWVAANATMALHPDCAADAAIALNAKSQIFVWGGQDCSSPDNGQTGSGLVVTYP